MIEPFARPTSAILCGRPAALLNWVALGLAKSNPGDYFWTDVRLDGQKVDASDPLATGAVPSDHLHVLAPTDLVRNQAPADSAVASVVRHDGLGASPRLLVDFLRLPAHTQELLAARSQGSPAILLVLSNANRIASQYPTDTVGPLIRTIVSTGASILLVFADEPPQGRLGFENIWHLRGSSVDAWRTVTLEVEAGAADAPYPTGSTIPLPRLPGLAGLLDSNPVSRP